MKQIQIELFFFFLFVTENMNYVQRLPAVQRCTKNRRIARMSPGRCAVCSRARRHSCGRQLLPLLGRYLHFSPHININNACSVARKADLHSVKQTLKKKETKRVTAE